jgi:hypothetical protein
MTTNHDNPSNPERDVAGEEAESKKPDGLPPDVLATLQQMEKRLTQIRGALDAAARDGAHREFSLWRIAGSILQVIVAGLVVLDWLLQAPVDSLTVKLAFAAVLQLAALTAFVVARDRA